MITANAEQAIQSIQKEKIQDYKDYWDTLTPKTDREYFLRWVFSFLSVHTTWSSNVTAFKLLDNDRWWNDSTLLSTLLTESKVGLYKRRTKGLAEFSKAFWENPEEWKKKPTETWLQCRDRLAAKCHGLGLAKTAFALEMCYPLENESVCIDTHMLQLYGFTTNKEKAKATQYKRYTEMEAHWANQCKLADVPAYIGRTLFWDKLQKQEDSRYWAYVFEKKQENVQSTN